MRKVVEHGKYYQEKKKTEDILYRIQYVECPECGSRIRINLDYPMLAVCKCECEFSFEEEDVMCEQLIKYEF